MKRSAILIPIVALALVALCGCGEDASWTLAVQTDNGFLYIEHPAAADSLGVTGQAAALAPAVPREGAAPRE